MRAFFHWCCAAGGFGPVWQIVSLNAGPIKRGSDFDQRQKALRILSFDCSASHARAAPFTESRKYKNGRIFSSFARGFAVCPSVFVYNLGIRLLNLLSASSPNKMSLWCAILANIAADANIPGGNFLLFRFFWETDKMAKMFLSSESPGEVFLKKRENGLGRPVFLPRAAQNYPLQNIWPRPHGVLPVWKSAG